MCSSTFYDLRNIYIYFFFINTKICLLSNIYIKVVVYNIIYLFTIHCDLFISYLFSYLFLRYLCNIYALFIYLFYLFNLFIYGNRM